MANPKMKVGTPIGVFSWPYLSNPQTKFNPDGEYKVDVVFAPDFGPFQAFRSSLEEFAERARIEMKLSDDTPIHLPIADHKENKEPTGDKVVRCKLPAVRKLDGVPAPQRPKIVDAKRNPIVPAPNVGSGTKGKVACDAVANYVQNTLYVTLYIRGVQIVDLVEFGDMGDGAAYGFEDEDGYEAVELESSFVSDEDAKF